MNTNIQIARLAFDVLKGIAALALVAALFVLFLFATPDQLSGAADFTPATLPADASF